MNGFLKHYTIKIHTKAPVYIGSGEKLGKKEYIFIPPTQTLSSQRITVRKPEQRGSGNTSKNGRVIVPDLMKMYQALEKKKLIGQYENYMLRNNVDDLYRWLKNQRITESEMESWANYQMDPGDAFVRNNSSNKQGTAKEILTFVKDSYGMPYVPGSSIKGYIRTALMTYEIKKNPERYQRNKNSIISGAQGSSRYIRSDWVLSSETTDLEVAVFHTLGRKAENAGDKKDAVNSNMSGLIISDSKPLSADVLTLSQKIDYTLQGEERPLPILREAIKPETDIFLELTIDTKTFPYTIEQIFEALDLFQEEVYLQFYKKFCRGSNASGTLWLGGGVGFPSKTIIYPMFGKDGLKVTDSIFQQTLKGGNIYQKHKHNKDLYYGAAPHVCKCTRYNRKLYDMGMAEIRLVADDKES